MTWTHREDHETADLRYNLTYLSTLQKDAAGHRAQRSLLKVLPTECGCLPSDRHHSTGRSDLRCSAEADRDRLSLKLAVIKSMLDESWIYSNSKQKKTLLNFLFLV